MRIRNLLTVLAVVALSVTAAGGVSAADKYGLDITHSSIQFSVKHMVISNVKGSFDKFEGVIMLDPDDMANSSVEVSIDVASVDTKDEKRDNHLRGEDFFDAGKHPNITFVSKKVMKQDDGYVAAGTLTIRGVAKEVELPFVLNGPITNPWGQTVIGIEMNYKINRQDFGIKWNKSMDAGGLVVGDDVKIEINLEATKS